MKKVRKQLHRHVMLLLLRRDYVNVLDIPVDVSQPLVRLVIVDDRVQHRLGRRAVCRYLDCTEHEDQMLL